MATQPTAIPLSANEEASAPRLRIRPTKILPTDRLNFLKQLELLKAWAALSSPAGTAVSNADVAEMMKLNESTISLANPFFASTGLLQKVKGGYLPSSDVVAYHRAAEYSDTPAHKLAPTMRTTWFGTALLPKLSFRPLTEQEALAVLHDTATAGIEYRNQIRMLIDYLIAAGLAQRDGEMIKAARPSFEFGPDPQIVSEDAKALSEIEAPAPPRQTIATGFAASPEGGISFHITVRVNMDQFANWKPERITAFFGGIAQMLAAKADVERGEK